MRQEIKTIKDLEYSKHLLGLPEQGITWKANAETIAIDKAIQALQEKQEREQTPTQSCESCKHYDTPWDFEPCASCISTQMTNWEVAK